MNVLKINDNFMKYFCIYDVWLWYSCVFGNFFLRFYNIEEINVLEVMLVIVNYKCYVKG